MELITDEQKECINCQDCCKINLMPINPDHRTLHLYYTKGIPLVYQGESRYWSIYLDKPCPHLSPDGCMIYNSPKKPKICSQYHCKIGAENFRKDVEQQLAETKQLLAIMFEGEKNDDTSESDR